MHPALRLLAGWAVLCAVVLGWGLVLTRALEGSVGQVDDEFARWVAGRRSDGLTPVAQAGAAAGGTVTGAIAVLLLCGVVALIVRDRRPLAFGAAAYGGLFAIYLSATTLVPRDRPPVRILDPGLVPDHSFPSGHVMTASVLFGGALLLAAYAGWAHRALLWPLLLVPLATALARIYQGAHHVTDTLTSLVVATVWLLWVARVVLRRDRPEAPPDR